MNKREQENSLLQDKIQIQEKKASELVQKSVESLNNQSQEEMNALLNSLHRKVKNASSKMTSDLKEVETWTQEVIGDIREITSQIQDLDSKVKNSKKTFQNTVKELNKDYQENLKLL